MLKIQFYNIFQMRIAKCLFTFLVFASNVYASSPIKTEPQFNAGSFGRSIVDEIFDLKNEEVLEKLGPKIDSLSRAQLKDVFEYLKTDLESRKSSLWRSYGWPNPPSESVQKGLWNFNHRIEKIAEYTKSRLELIKARHINKFINRHRESLKLAQVAIGKLPNIGKSVALTSARSIPLIGEAIGATEAVYLGCESIEMCRHMSQEKLKRDTEYIRNLNYQVQFSNENTKSGFLTPQTVEGTK